MTVSPPDSPPRLYARPCRSAGAALARNAARQWREELPLLKRRWKLLAACASMQYLHAIAGQARPPQASSCALKDRRAARVRAGALRAPPFPRFHLGPRELCLLRGFSTRP